ncbi:putative ATP-dependent RNA helicase SoYb [Phlebotomus argentipes]|uniref:putative ATP-dependent RNA helicase SoYb n=1 Tax=Phlebotomus argentipes TaxID=94469 RepID=UPI0028932188|nr:putative ATP-dependent RNA helicase SoYb [Phlebotomus argentipes]
MENITITHFISPHSFWFKLVDEQDDEIDAFRAKLKRAMKATENCDSWSPVIGETVGYYRQHAAVWDRATVQNIAADGVITLWLEDMGLPEKAKRKQIKPMPKNIAPPMQIVRQGGLALTPVKKKYNTTTFSVNLVDSEDWSQDAIELMKDVISCADKILFEVKITPKPGLCFGIMLFHLPDGKKLTAEELLADFSCKSDRFLEMIYPHKSSTLQQKSEEIVTSASTSRDFVSNWVEKTIDVQNDDFDESVSTYHPAETAKISNGTSHPVFRHQHETVVVVEPLRRRLDTRLATTEMPYSNIELDRPIREQYEAMAMAGKKAFNEKQLRMTESSRSKLTPMPGGMLNGKDLPRINGKAKKQDKKFKLPKDVPEEHVQETQQQTPKIEANLEDEFDFNLTPRCKKINPSVIEKPRISHSVYSDCASRTSMEASTKYALKAYLEKQRLSLSSSEDKAVKTAMKPNSLETDVKQLGEAAVDATAKKRYQRVLVHSPLAVKMVERITEAPFRQEVHDKLRQSRIADVHRVQSFGWPHIFRGGSIILIGQRRSGKTLTYLPMLFTHLLNRKETTQSGYSPIGASAIVICASSKSVTITSTTFVGYHDVRKMKLNVLASTSPCHTQRYVKELQNGYDVLFTTAPALTRLMQEAKRQTVDLVTLDNVQFVVVDDYDAIVEDFRQELHSLLNFLLSRVDEYGKCRTQVVLTSSKWLPEFREQWQQFDNPMLCITSGVESALYANAKFSLEIMDREMKANTIREILTTEAYFNEPTMIVCNTEEEVDFLTDVLLKLSISIMAFKVPSLEKFQMKDKAVILCTDACILDVNVRDIQHLIHFSLPEKWSMFDKRFVVCFDYYENQLVCSETTKSPVMIHIFLDQDNDVQLPKLIHFMRTRFKDGKIAPEILQCAEANLQRREWDKISREVRLCPAMMEFGECRINQLDCASRHVFCDADKPSILLPKMNCVRMKILSVISPLHFQCHLLHAMKEKSDHFKKWRVVNSSDGFLTFQHDLNCHMVEQENKITPASADVRVQDVFVIQCNDNYCRVRVEFVKRERGMALVTISGVDLPVTKRQVQAQDLLLLPDEFRAFPQQLIDVRLFGLVPNDYEMQWDSNSTKEVKSWVEPSQTSEYLSFIGQIDLTLKNTIYVKSLFCVEFVDSHQSNFVQRDLRKVLLRNQIAVEIEEEKMQFIKDLAIHYGIYSEEEFMPVDDDADEAPRRIEREMEEENWMRLEHEEITSIYVLSFESLFEFYVQDLRKAKDLRRLKENIADFVGMRENLKPLETPNVGDYCLIEFEGEFCRGKVWQEASDGDDEYCVFFVDEGISEYYQSSQMFEASPEIVSDFPFFAIRCSMAGVKAKNQMEATQEELDEIFEKFIKEQNDCLILHACAVDECTLRYKDIWKLTKYSIILLAEDPKEHVVINERLVEANYCDRDEKKWTLVVDFLKDRELSQQLSVRERDEAEEEVPNWDDKIPANVVKTSKKVEKVTEEILDSDDTTSSVTPPPEPFFPAPSVQWHQTDQEIILTVSAVDMKSHHLSVHPMFLTLCIVFEDRPQQGCVINFFGCVDEEKTVVKKRANSLTIKLCKSLPGKQFHWPYFMDPPEKVPWLKPAILVDSSDSENEGEIVKRRHIDMETDSDHVDSEEEQADSDNELFFDGFENRQVIYD